MGLESELRKEIKKWTERIEKELEKVKTEDKRFLANIRAYVKDSKYFLEKNDLIRSFEAIIWAWAWLEIGREVGVVKNAPGQGMKSVNVPSLSKASGKSYL